MSSSVSQDVRGSAEQIAPSPAAVEQARRGRSSVSSGVGERVADVFIGGALVALGLRRRGLLGAGLIGGGGWFLSAAATGRFAPYAALNLVRAGRSSRAPLIIERSITIDKPREEVYAFWRDFARLPAFMPHLIEVVPIGAKRSHWIARAPFGRQAEWDAEITDDRPGTRIAWQSLAGTGIANAGEVRFLDAPGQRGAEVWVRLTYQPPLGTASAALARLTRQEPDQQVDADLRRLKAILETGEAPTVQGQPHGKHIWGNKGKGDGKEAA